MITKKLVWPILLVWVCLWLVLVHCMMGLRFDDCGGLTMLDWLVGLVGWLFSIVDFWLFVVLFAVCVCWLAIVWLFWMWLDWWYFGFVGVVVCWVLWFGLINDDLLGVCYDVFEVFVIHVRWVACVCSLLNVG